MLRLIKRVFETTSFSATGMRLWCLLLVGALVASSVPASSISTETVLQDKRSHLIFWDTDSSTLHVWDPATSVQTTPIQLAASPNHIAYSSTWDAIVVGYATGELTRIDLEAAPFSETFFAKADQPIRRMAEAGNFLVIGLGDESITQLQTYRANGSLISSLSGDFEMAASIWRPTLGEFHSIGVDKHITDIDAAGVLLSHRTNGRHVTRSDDAHLSQSPDGEHMLLDNRRVQTHPNSAFLVTVVDRANYGVWKGDKLFIAAAENGEIKLLSLPRSNNYYNVTDQTSARGRSPKLFLTAGGELVMVHRFAGRTILSVYSESLDLLRRHTFAGSDLLDDSARLMNLSTRATLDSGQSATFVVGFVIQGTSSMRVLLRAIGPALAAYDVSDPLADPQFSLYDSSQRLIAINNDWADEDSAAISSASQTVGAFPLPANSTDSAMIATLAPGAYTAVVTRRASGGKTVLFEAYDYAESGNTSSLSNLSCRSDAGSGENALVVGFVIRGDSKVPVLVRAVGPNLSRFGVNNPMTDPALTIRTQDGAVVAANDNWSNDNDQAEAASLVGAFNLSEDHLEDAAAVVELPPSPYTATAAAADAEIGNVLVEIYQIRD